MRKAAMEPTGIANQIRLRFCGLGPPMAKVPAQLMKMAQGGRCQGGMEMKMVVTASRDATTSAGGFFMKLSSNGCGVEWCRDGRDGCRRNDASLQPRARA